MKDLPGYGVRKLTHIVCETKRVTLKEKWHPSVSGSGALCRSPRLPRVRLLSVTEAPAGPRQPHPQAALEGLDLCL